MCAFAPLVMAGISIASAATSYEASANQSRNQANYENKMSSETGANALTNFQQQTGVANTRMEQNALSAGQQAQAMNTQGAAAEGHADAAAAGSGVSGNSVQELHNDLARVDAMNQNAISTNLSNQNMQLGQQEKAIQAGAQSTINQATPQPVNTPSLAGALLSAGTGVLQAGNSFEQSQGTGPYNANPGQQSNVGWMYRPFQFSG